MTDNQRKKDFSENILPSRLFICVFPCTERLARILLSILDSDRYYLRQIYLAEELVDFVEQQQEEIDCLIFLNEPDARRKFDRLSQQGILLPTIILNPEVQSPDGSIEPEITFSNKIDKVANDSASHFTYLLHSAEVRLEWHRLEQITTYIDRAITQFLNLSPSCDLSGKSIQLKRDRDKNNQNFLMLQQRRLAEKLKERLGYLGVYYKRNPPDFYRNLSAEDKQEFIEQLSQEYRQIILDYFSENNYIINELIDRFVNKAFFADFSVPQLLEIHMNLMDEFSQQLKLEGRSEEILLDYRLALIDIIAHLCEMYRRSIPREDIPFELLFRID
ncbi:MAG: circadian clock protein KaiA [Xenococcaceae cyanobacterium]